jgi:hypothetical protein
MFDLGMFPPFGSFGRNSPTHCLGETPFETVSGRISHNNPFIITPEDSLSFWYLSMEHLQ